MESWSWTNRSRTVLVGRVDPLIPSWMMHLKRHPGSGSDDEDTNMEHSDLKIITWNAQGAGSRDFLISLKELIRMHDPPVLVLVETRISGVHIDKICQRIGFDGILRSKAIGFSGGIWILRRKSVVELKQIDYHRQVVSMDSLEMGKINGCFLPFTQARIRPTGRSFGNAC
ncbi:hypothetical protein V2J09_017712 [Rumex salicifolius]